MPKTTKSAKRKAPWKKAAPKGTRPKSLSPAQRARAKKSAKRAGRPYPNLVDNMQAAKGRTSKGRTSKGRTSKGRASKGRTSKGRAAGKRKATRNPKGGLTAAGRKRLRRTEGARLRPGVKKTRQSDMTPDEMRRKGSWAVRFYGRKRLPALVTSDGKPTRFALTAAAWGEAVPKTLAAARRIAAKGKRLLEAYQRKRKR